MPTVTVFFDDASVYSGQVFRGGTSLSLSQNIVNSTTLPAPTIAALGISAPATVTSASQTIRVTGPVGAAVRLLRVLGDMNLNGGVGYDLDPFEANSAITVAESAATIGGGGFVDIPVTLTRTSDSSDLNVFSAVVVNSDGSGQTSLVSNGIVLEYVPAAAGTVLIDGASIKSVCEGNAADTTTLASVVVGSQANRILVVEVGAEEDNADCDLALASATATYGGVAMSKAVTKVSDTTTWRSCNGIFYLLNPHDRHRQRGGDVPDDDGHTDRQPAGGRVRAHGGSATSAGSDRVGRCRQHDHPGQHEHHAAHDRLAHRRRLQSRQHEHARDSDDAGGADQAVGAVVHELFRRRLGKTGCSTRPDLPRLDSHERDALRALARSVRAGAERRLHGGRGDGHHRDVVDDQHDAE